ncbi:cyclin b [Nannochloropsis gaditana]|uniref:Cyclin b n=1 Tax=Nannochloropsis gaditana TaxID=72520 RepID=W7TIC3_9STRA|nr:cyclin b [Nannochloropsis gaditana]
MNSSLPSCLPPSLPPFPPSDEVLAMEQKMLQHFRFRISMPTLHAFLTRFLKLGAGGHLCSPRAFYFAERALQEHEILHYRPSLVAAAALYLARRNETLDAWTPTLIAYSGYTEADVFPIAVLLSKWAHETTQTQSRRLLNAVKKKFSSSKWSEVAEADHLRLPVS